MKKLTDILLASRYAHAFINQYPCLLTLEIRDSLKQLYLYLNLQKSALASTDLFLSEAQKKSAIIKACLDEESAKEWPIQKLFALLFIDRRLSLFPLVLEQIEKILMQKQKMVTMTMESSYDLSLQEQDLLIRFFAHKTGCTVQSSFSINKDLIAGVRLSSSTILWEQSIARRLHKLSLALAE